MAAAINSGRLVEFPGNAVKESIHHPGTERYDTGDVNQDDSSSGVGQPIDCKKLIIGHKQHNRRKHLSHKNEHHDHPFSFKLKTGEPIAGQRGEEDRKYGSHRGDNHTVL